MELKFAWIEDYKNIKNTGFNFNHSIDEEFQFINNEIIISPLSKTPKNFFKDNVTGVTVIVGKNGSGKTNLTEFINYNLAHVTNGSLETIIQENKGLVIIDNYIFIQETVKLNNTEELKKIGYEISYFENAPLDKHGARIWAKMDENKYIYYSSAFEFRFINVRNNLTNISTSYLAFNDIYKTTKHYNFDRANHLSFNYNPTDSLTAHYVNEMVRESDFILNFNIQEYIGETPTDLKISIDILKENRLLQKPDFYKTEDKKEIHTNKLWEELWELENSIGNNEYAELNDYKLPDTDEADNYHYYLIPIESQKILFRKFFLINLFKILLNTGNNFELGFFYDFIYTTNLIKNKETGETLFSINKKLELLINECVWKDKNQKFRKSDSSFNKSAKIHFELIRSAELKINTIKKKKIFQELLVLSREITQNRLFFHYQFSNNYSSGQQNLLNFYSRFYWAKNELLESEKSDIYESFRKQIIIFIDEGEVALHPEWQRVFFNKITTFLSELFNDRKIQLILTTHSPFVLSDIPKNNVVFLDRDENGNTKISNLEKIDTFGANIHELLADSFFLNEGFIGDFAKNKILDLISYLTFNDDDIESENNIKSKEKWSEDSAFKVINIVGEPIIKERLLALFDEKFTFKRKESILAKINELEKELKKFEK